MRASLAMLRAYERFNQNYQLLWARICVGFGGCLPRKAGPVVRGIDAMVDRYGRAHINRPLSQDRTEYLQQIRNAIRSQQYPAARRHRITLALLAGLFVLTILDFELWSKFFPHDSLGAYVFLFLYIASIVLYQFARRHRWQVIAEDYRGVMEILRIQIAWWDAGIDRFVGHNHLRSVDRNLNLVREGARPLISWARIRAQKKSLAAAWSSWGWEAPVSRWDKVYETMTPLGDESRASWVGGQIKFFRDSANLQQASVERMEALSWTLFLTSPFLVGAIVYLLSASSTLVDSLVPTDTIVGLACGVASLTVAVVVGWFVARIAVSTARSPIGRGMRQMREALYVVFAIVLAAAGLTCVLSLSRWVEGLPKIEKSTPDTLYAGLMVLVVALPTLAGAWRFYVERNNHQDQALHYDDMLRIFLRAEDRLRQLAPATDPTNSQRAREVVQNLGLLALNENEAWLKGHRERPAEPVIGG